jgi:putative nucleotidyltransferase with HDIG domain
MRRPSRPVIALNAALLAGAAVVAVLTATGANWDLLTLALLLGFAIASDLMAASIRSAKLKVSGSFLAIVAAMVLLGGAPAALVGVLTIIAGWIKWREKSHYLLANLASYAAFPLAGGLLFAAIRDHYSLQPGGTSFPFLVFGTFVLALAINFMLAALYTRHVDGSRVADTARRALRPLLISDLIAALMAVGVAEITLNWGASALAVFGVLLLAFQHLLSALLTSEERAEDLQRRTEQLASLQVGLLSALLRTLDLRDRMTARHSAAVARYAREIAKAAGLSEAEQELAHTAGLLHDIGKFVFPDSILKGNSRLTDDDYEIVKMHPFHGAQVLAQIEGYGPVANIVLAHHERIDGTGYPNGMPGDRIPVIARIISVADTYDVMTSRDSYRKPVTSQTAIAELRRVSGAQLDGNLVEIFAQILESKDVAYRHGEDADFETELALDRRVTEYASASDLPLLSALAPLDVETVLP